MNPRRPTPAGPEPAPFDQTRSTPLGSYVSIPNGLQRDEGSDTGGVAVTRPPSEAELRGFLEWCLGKGTSEETCRTYARYLQRPLDMSNKWSRLAWKAYYKYVGREDLWRSIKVKRSGVDLYVPSDEEVESTLRLACSGDEGVCWAYRLLVYSGLRLVEAVRVLREADPSKWIRLHGYWKYPLAWKRGSKQALYAYSLEKPPRLGIRDYEVSDWASEAKKEEPRIVSPKYVRKWVATKMLWLGIPEEVVNFIQGRVPQGVLAKHYLKLSTLADQYYPKYAEWLRNNNII